MLFWSVILTGRETNEHNPAEITLVWPNMRTNHNLYVAHACRDNDVLSGEYYSQFTDLVIKQLKLVELWKESRLLHLENTKLMIFMSDWTVLRLDQDNLWLVQ